MLWWRREERRESYKLTADLDGLDITMKKLYERDKRAIASCKWQLANYA